ncbi:hypothetical protein SY83_20135 [Paenibacillus swuensis]|uniref:Uncharacterized protein n=1 Tax=Paenibacillus swuensis TaxID=1178515 RepID=A0A172TN14_9BACL|nr:hypothetical protein [Paenibacillus swuensis]ANE48217.1 hypothetical protein SY83_20135 [Paenibacillus swuensis]
MLGKFFIFSFLWYLLGNPFLALLVMLAVIYVLDRQFVGIFPSLRKPFKRLQHIRRLKQTIALNPNDTSSKYELARLEMERRKYESAGKRLEGLRRPLEDSADYWVDSGTVKIKLQQSAEGESEILKGLSINPRSKYGAPYLLLADHFAKTNHVKALQYLDRFREIHTSSCEAYYLLAGILNQLGKKKEAKEALDENIAIYRALPKYKRKQERKWIVRSLWKRLTL